MCQVTCARAIGSLMYVVVCTRLDISHVVGVLRTYMSKLGKKHWTTVKMILRYFCGTTYCAVCCHWKPRPNKELDVHEFVDDDWTRDRDHRWSTSGCVLSLFGGSINWMTKNRL